MGGLIRRRGIEEEATSPYPFESDYPELNEYGTFLLAPQNSSTGDTNAFLKSGTTNYTYLGSYSRVTQTRITITEEEIILYKNTSYWKTYAFAGFPVRFKRCLGGVNNDPKVTFLVTKES